MNSIRFFTIETLDTGTKMTTQGGLGGLVISATCKRQGGDPPIWRNGDPQSSKYTRGNRGMYHFVLRFTTIVAGLKYELLSIASG